MNLFNNITSSFQDPFANQFSQFTKSPGKSSGQTPVNFKNIVNPTNIFQGFGNQVGQQGSTMEQPTVQTTTPREFGVAPGYEGNTDQTQGSLYKGLHSVEPAINAVTNFLPDYSKGLQTVGSSIQSGLGSTAEQVSNPTVLTTQDVLAKMQKIRETQPNITNEQMQRAFQYLKDNHNYVFSNNPLDKVPNLARAVGGGILNTVGQVFGGGANALGSTMEGVGNITKGDTNLGASQIVRGIGEGSIAGVNAMYPGTSSFLNSKEVGNSPVGSIMNAIGQGSQYVTGKGLDLTGMDPNSPEYQNYKQGISTALPLVAIPKAMEIGGKVVNKVSPYIESGLNQAKARVASEPIIKPTMTDGMNAVSKEGVQGTVPEPGTVVNIKDKVFGSNDNIDLANRAVSPRNVKGKTMADKMQGGKVALDGLQQLHNDSIAGNITEDIGTIEGGIAGLEEARQYHGKIIGENASPTETINPKNIAGGISEAIKGPLAEISGPIKQLGESLVSMMERPEYKKGITLKDTQSILSLIKSRIRDSQELRSALSSDPIGQKVAGFIDELSNQYDTAIEKGGNGPADKAARQAYAKIMKIQNDLLNSGMVNARNTKTGQSGFVGKSIATYELLKHGISGIPVAITMKYLGETKGEYATRGGAYAKLIRNMDRQALQRTQGKYTTGDTSKFTPKPTKNDGKPSNISRNPVDLARAKNVKPIVMSKKLSTGISENAKIRDPRVTESKIVRPESKPSPVKPVKVEGKPLVQVTPKSNTGNAKTGEKITTTVYHGTNKEFGKLDKKFLGSNTGETPTNMSGFSFTDNPELAKTFGKRIIEKKVTLNNPYVIDAKGGDYGSMKHKINDAIEYAQNNGHDGIVIKNYHDAGLGTSETIQSNHLIEFSKIPKPLSNESKVIKPKKLTK